MIIQKLSYCRHITNQAVAIISYVPVPFQFTVLLALRTSFFLITTYFLVHCATLLFIQHTASSCIQQIPFNKKNNVHRTCLKDHKFIIIIHYSSVVITYVLINFLSWYKCNERAKNARYKKKNIPTYSRL